MNHLKLTRHIKKRIEIDLHNQFEQAKENGETFEEIICCMGTPQDVAEEFNKSYLNNLDYIKERKINTMKKVPFISFILALIPLTISFIGKYIVLNGSNVTQTGGVDGPTSISVTSERISTLVLFNWLQKIGYFFIVVMLISGGIYIYKKHYNTL